VATPRSRAALAMNHIESARFCASCGIDLSQRDCFLNSRGEHHCLPCYEAAKNCSADTAVPEALKACVLCGGRVERKDCHQNRHGRYVCEKCHRPRKRRTWQHAVKKSLRWLVASYERILLWVMYACFITFCLWLLYTLMARIAAPPVVD